LHERDTRKEKAVEMVVVPFLVALALAVAYEVSAHLDRLTENWTSGRRVVAGSISLLQRSSLAVGCWSDLSTASAHFH
jgi:hypothetical protein